MIKRRRWPVPTDTALDRARAIAREYRDALYTADPDRAMVLDAAAVEFGETWLVPTPQYDDADLLTLTDLAAALGEKYGTVWAWWHRGHIPREPSGLFRLDEVLDALAERKHRRPSTAATEQGTGRGNDPVQDTHDTPAVVAAGTVECRVPLD